MSFLWRYISFIRFLYLWFFFSLTFVIILLYYSKIINNSLCFFCRYISFFRYIFIMLSWNCLWVLLLFSLFSNPRNSISTFITNQLISYICCFSNCFLEEVFNASVANCTAWPRSLCLYLPLTFLLIFLHFYQFIYW